MMLYIHVPFCKKKCRYCSFYSISRADYDASLIDDYIDFLLLEMEKARNSYGKHRITSVFIGGGTPSILNCEQIASLFDGMHRNFEISSDAEITFEGNPDSLCDVDKLNLLKNLGCNRISIGVQSFVDSELRCIGRIHSALDAKKSVKMAKDTGFDNINIDLIWGIPNQNMNTLEYTLTTTFDLNPSHISAYCLTLEEGTPLWHDVKYNHTSLPDEDLQADFYFALIEGMKQAGYFHYEISNYCRPKYECRHNCGYWMQKDYIGVGPAAIGTINGIRYSNPNDITKWMKNIKEKKTPHKEILTSKSLNEEMLFLSLRTKKGLNIEKYKNNSSRDLIEDHHELILALEKSGLIELKCGYLSLTDRGMLISNSIIAELM